MAQFNLYVDTWSGQLVASTTNSTAVTLPKLVQGDTVTFRIYLLERSTTYPKNPFNVINNSGLSLKVALGPKNGTAGSTLYTQQFTWTADAQNQYFSGTLALNTTGINTLIGSAESAEAWFEIEYIQGGVPTTVFQVKTTVHAEVIETGSLTTPAGEVAATVSYCEGTFLKARNTGFVLYNPTTGGQVQCYLADDGSVQFAPIA